MIIKKIPVNNQPKENHLGTTLIELLVSVAMTAVLISIVFAFWQNFNYHIITQRRKTILQTEIQKISESLVSQLRRSSGILAWHSSGITFISPHRDDTIVYEHYADELLKNDIPIPLIAQDAFISEFDIEAEEQLIGEGHNSTQVISIVLTIEDDFDNQQSLRSTVVIKLVRQYEEEELSKWNF